jgi:hypothetical protein
MEGQGGGEVQGVADQKNIAQMCADALSFCLTHVENFVLSEKPVENKSVTTRPWLWLLCFLFFVGLEIYILTKYLNLASLC